MRVDASVRAMVVIAQDLLRSSISDALRLHGINVVLECRTPLDARRSVEAVRPDAALVEVSLPAGAEGFDLGHDLRQRLPRLGLVFLASSSDPRLLGARADLPRASTFISRAAVNDVGELASSLRDSVGTRATSAQRMLHRRRVDLTDHQVEVLKRLAAGATNAQIGAQMQVTPKAVEQSISRIAKRLGLDASNDGNLRVQLAAEYLRLAAG